MKLTLFLSIMTIFQLWATDESYSQLTKLTLKLEDVKVSDALREIENQSEFFFLYSPKLIDVERKVNIDSENETITAILSDIFGGNVKFGVYDRQIILTKSDLTISSAVVQQLKITGTITDATTGEPLVGVNIVVEGTTTGAISDINGKYSIAVPNLNSVLQFSYIGYINQNIPLNGRTVIDLTLTSDIQALEDVIVIGYGSVRKTDLTGSVSSIKAADIIKMPSQRVDQALQGRSAGVYVLNTDGSPGGQTLIRIRGLNSISGGNEPLIVVDGLQGVNLNSINPSDISSLEILKDASATAIYGSRGANGVILITTKVGKIGKPVIDAGYSTTFQTLSRKLPTMNAADYARRINTYKMSLTGEGNIPVPQFSAAEIADFEKNGGTDWQDEIFKTGVIQSANLAISGATDKLKYMISSNLLDHQGIVLESKYSRASFRANLSADITKWVDFGLNYNYTKETYESPRFRGGDSGAQIIKSALLWAPTEPKYDANGNYSKHRAGYGATSYWNPLAIAYEPIYNIPTYRNNANLFLNFKIMKGLSLKITGGAMFTNGYYRSYLNKKTFEGFLNSGQGSVSESVNEKYQNTNILTYDNTFGAHHLNFTGVIEQISETTKSSYIDARNFLVDQLNFNNLGGAKMVTVGSSNSERGLLSYMGRLNYGLKDRYLATISYRADASSVFGKDNKWGYFPSGSMAWRISQEDFVKNISFITDLKLRGSYGVTGNQGISPYQSLARLGSGRSYSYPWNGGSTTDLGFGISGLANPKLKWETTKQTDIGLDISLFKGRLTSTVDIYKKVTDNLLYNRSMPLYVGVNSILDNIGSIENKGIEIMIGGDPLTGDVKWNTSFNITMNKNKILNLGLDRFAGDEDQPWEVGHSFDEITGYVFMGIWGTAQDTEARAYGQLPGDPHYADINGGDEEGNIIPGPDGVINEFDRALIGHGYPRLTWGWNNLFTYKQFELSFLFVGSHNQDLVNTMRTDRESEWQGTDPVLLDYWTPTNQDTKIPGLIDQKYREEQNLLSTIEIGLWNQSDSRWVEDASFIRLSTASISYSFEQKLLKAIGFQKARVSLSGSNLLTITKYTGYDPEVTSSPNDGGIGWDSWIYPKARSITFGIDFTF